MNAPRETLQNTAADAPPQAELCESRRLVWLIAALVTVLLAWSSWFTLDVASHSTGEVISSAQTNVVQHLEGGIVRRIFVREGQVVAAGDALAELERVASETEMRELESFLGALQLRELRLIAQIEGRSTIDIPDDLAARFPEQAQTMRDLFEAQRGRLSSGIEEQQQRIAQRQAEAAELRARRSQLRSRLTLLSEQIQISERLLAEGLANRFEHLNLLQEEETVRGNLSELEASLRRVEASLRQEQAALGRLGSGDTEDLQRELADARRQMTELQERLRRFTDSQERLVVRSPIDGVVMTLNVVTAGGVVQPGGALMSLVALNEPMLIEARLPVGDVGMVSVGQAARLQLMSSVARGFQPIDGQVVEISPDSILDEQRIPYYRVRIQPVTDAFVNGEQRYPLIPGVPVGVVILTGDRSLFDYLAGPLTSGMRRAFTEP